MRWTIQISVSLFVLIVANSGDPQLLPAVLPLQMNNKLSGRPCAVAVGQTPSQTAQITTDFVIEKYFQSERNPDKLSISFYSNPFGPMFNKLYKSKSNVFC